MNIHQISKPLALRWVLGVCFVLAAWVPRGGAAVSLEKLPEPGLQPQALTSPDGTVHLIYLKGDPKAADVVYRRKTAGQTSWGAPLRVNSQAGSAIAVGTIRGAQLAVGRQGAVHVAWNGSSSALPKPVNGGTPMLYARLQNGGSSFSEQRNLMTASHELDGGGAVAADSDGRVFVIWHASPAGISGETNRAVYLALSKDDGSTFAPERRISPEGSGACGCCGLTAKASTGGDVFVLFRTARSPLQRDMSLLVSSDHGAHFTEALSHPWSINACPMSSANLSDATPGVWAAWETAGQIHFAHFSNLERQTPTNSAGPKRAAKHPRIAANSRGETLVVWTEGTGWQRGGDLGWQVLDSKGQSTAEKGRLPGIPAWHFATVFTKLNGDFVILH